VVFDNISFHNVDELNKGPDGYVLQRVPEELRIQLNENARNKMQIPASVELRFVSTDDTVRVTLSCPEGRAVAVPFWGPFQGSDPITVGPSPEPVAITVPERLNDADLDAIETEFSPRVRRLRFHRDSDGPVCYHGVEGDTRPPTPDELPDSCLLTYGTSITEGNAATRAHLTYAGQTAHRLQADLVNLGSGGSAYCEPEIADYIADRDDWDVATFALSVNMLNHGFPLQEFRERAAYMMDSIAEAGRTVVAITLFPFYEDVDPSLRDDSLPATAEEYRETLRRIVTNAGHENLHLLEGPDLMSGFRGHSPDLVHPGDHGMIRIGERLGAEIERLRDRN